MKRIFFLVAVFFLTAVVSPEVKAQCPPEQDCPAPPPGSDDGGDEDENTSCWTNGVEDYYTQVGTSWLHCYKFYRACQAWNEQTQQYYIYYYTWENCTHYPSAHNIKLTPTGIGVKEFDVLKMVMKETPAYASLRIPKSITRI
jgi:hypothetical protein